MKNDIFKDAIAKVFMKLAKEKPLRDITVGEIASACGISRQTFYNHFKDKYDLIEYLYQPAEDKFNEITAESGSDIRSGLLHIFEECYNNREYYMSVLSYEGQNSFEEICLKNNKAFYINYLTRKYGPDIIDKTMEMNIDFSCHGATVTLLNWIRKGMKETPEYMASELYKCLPEKLRNAMSETQLF